MSSRALCLVRSAGDVATGTGRRLFLAGFAVVMTEIERPLCVRRRASFAEAVYDGSVAVEGVEARLAQPGGLDRFPFREAVAVVVDPRGDTAEALRPPVIVDARMLKRNPDTRIDQAEVVGALGPGYTAGVDCHFVVETLRGHDLGRVIRDGTAAPDTGRRAPRALRAGHAADRVLYAACAGTIEPLRRIGDVLAAGDAVCRVGGAVHATRIDGVLRGLVRPGIEVSAGTKIADVDPAARSLDGATVSDRANAIAGGVLEGVLPLLWRNER